MVMNQCPCGKCTRVKDPKNCENKGCQVWRKWFLKRWSLIHQFYEENKEVWK